MKPAIGILIPTFNRVNELRETLAHLERQTWRDFEVVIVDDGSNDQTRQMVEAYQTDAPYPLLYLRQTNSGPATARNLGVLHMAAPVCLLIGDDIFASPELVEQHLQFHRDHPNIEAAAVGLTCWAEHGQIVTPFMRWLDRDGVQFAYGELLNGAIPGWKHFYTSNLSLKTAYLRQNPFDERFCKASMEDIELGYRLSREHGLQMHFLPDAIAEHLHPTTFERACQRSRNNGANAWIFENLWPEIRRVQFPRNPLKRIARSALLEPKIVLPALEWLTNSLHRVWCPNPLTGLVLVLYERLGYLEAGRHSRTPHLSAKTVEGPQ